VTLATKVSVSPCWVSNSDRIWNIGINHQIIGDGEIVATKTDLFSSAPGLATDTLSRTYTDESVTLAGVQFRKGMM
jgi:hypothetical protein